MYYLLHRNQLHVSALFMAIFRLIMRNLISSYARFACVVYSGEACEISYQPHLLPPLYIQHKQIECNCLLSFSLSTWRWQWIVPKHVVDFYVINNTYLFHQIVVLDIRYIPIQRGVKNRSHFLTATSSSYLQIEVGMVEFFQLIIREGTAVAH